MSTSHLRLDVDVRGVARVTLDRPDVLNAFNEELIAELTETFTMLGADPAVRIVVLAATGRVFCAGADIDWMRRAAARDNAANLEDAGRFARMMEAIATCPKPVLARVQGAAFGGGVGIACAVDIAVASERARFSVSEAKFGILPAVIGPYLVNALGPRQAKRLALTATTIDAQQALALGLVQQVVEESALDAAIEATVGELLANGPAALAEIKRLFSQLEVGPVTSDVQALTARTISRVRGSAEAQEGFAAFVDKRAPSWTRAPQQR